MTRREDLEQAATAARASVDDAREALRQLRADAAGGRARSVGQAEQQLVELRHALAADVRELRSRARGIDLGGTTAPLRGALVAGTAALVGVIGAVGAAVGTAAGRRARRETERQATALAAAMARLGTEGVAAADRVGKRTRGRGLITAVLGAATVAGLAIAVRRGTGPADDDLWLPERDEADPTDAA
jgi:hypothetical protein